MESMLHPISGEQGYFCSHKEKTVIDAILNSYSSQYVLEASSDARGGEL